MLPLNQVKEFKEACKSLHNLMILVSLNQGGSDEGQPFGAKVKAPS